MAQISSSLTLTDDEGAIVLAAINEQFGAFQSSSAGTSAPSLTTPGMLWFDTLNILLYMRSADNTTWVLFPIDFTTGDLIGGTGGGGGGNVDTGDVITLSGDIAGDGTFDANGNMSISNTVIDLPNVVCIDGGDSSSTYPGQVTGPYGVGGGGSALTTEQNGTPLSTATTLYNFVGFNVTEPVTNEFQISFGIAAASNEYCPGYTSYTRVDDDEFTIDLVNAENLFNVGRRVKFDKAGVFDYGVINAVDFDITSANDTHVTLTMEGSDTVPTGTFDVCLVTSATAWSPIAGDPFSGTAINDICTGVIGATQWWFAVGNGGKVATSSDGGATWTLRTTVTTEDLTCCVYDSQNETFWGGGDAGVLVSTTNGTSITEDTSSIPALTGSDTDNIKGFAYNSVEDGLMCIYQVGASTYATAYSTDQGGTWTQGDSSTFDPASDHALQSVVNSGGGTGNVIYQVRNSSTTTRQYASVSGSDAAGDSVSTSGVPVSMGFGHDGTDSFRVYGCTNGDVVGQVAWVGDDDVTFTQQVNDFAFSPLHARLVCVGDNSQLGYLDTADSDVADAWTSVANGFDPTADVTAVDWNETDAVYVAVADNGQICRSSNGTN